MTDLESIPSCALNAYRENKAFSSSVQNGCPNTYRSGTVNSNTVNSKFHLIRSHCEIFFYHFPNISCLKCTVNSNFHLIRSKTLLTNDFELTVPDLYYNTNNTCLNRGMTSQLYDHLLRKASKSPWERNTFILFGG